MRLRNRQAYISTLPEGEPDKNKASQITRWLYFLVLFLVIAYLVYVGFIRLTQFQGRGQIEVEKTIISPLRGGQIIDLAVTRGEEIEEGALIARIQAPSSCGPVDIDRSREDKLRFDINLKQLEIDLLRKRILFEKNIQDGIVVRRALELDKSRRVQKYQSTREIANLNFKIEALMQEAALQEARLKQGQSLPLVVVDPLCLDQLIRSPRVATVDSVSHKLFEFAARGEPLVTLVLNDAAVRIEAFVDNKYRRHITLGSEISVSFPDGSLSEGVVSEIVSTSAVSPRKEAKAYESLESRIRLHVVPASKADETQWRLRDRMEVTIGGFKE